MTKQEHVIKILEEKGYKPSIDKDGDVMVRYQMKYIFVQIQDPDDLYYRVFMPNIYPMDGGEEPEGLMIYMFNYSNLFYL